MFKTFCFWRPWFNRYNYDFEQGMESKDILVAVKLTEERHRICKGNKTSVNLETSESPSSAGKLLRKTGSLGQAVARGQRQGSELQIEEPRGSVMGRLAGSARRACDGGMVSALDMDRLHAGKFK